MASDAIEHVDGVLAGHAVAQRYDQRQRQGRRASGGRRSVLTGTLCTARRRQRHLQIGIGHIRLVKLGAVGIQQVGGNHGIEDARGIDCQRIHELGLGGIDGRKLMQQRFHIRVRHAALHKQARKHAGNHAVGEVEAIDHGRRTAIALLKCKQSFGRRQPQRACQAKSAPSSLSSSTTAATHSPALIARETSAAAAASSSASPAAARIT